MSKDRTNLHLQAPLVTPSYHPGKALNMTSPTNVLSELSTHLQQVDDDPTTLLDTALLEQGEILTNTPQYRDQTWKETKPLFLQIASLLPTLQQDPSPLTHFIIKLAEPYRFEDIKDIDFEIGLDLQATPFHSLILTLLEKATASSIDAQALANRPIVVSSVVRLWLCTQDAGVATQAEDLLTLLLSVSKNEPVATSSGADVPLHTYGTGPIWRRLFRDRDISSLFYHYTSLKQLSSPPLPLLNKRDTTIAQARLLSWLPRVGAMDFNTIVSSHGVDVEREIGIKEGQGLLHYAALKMVDTEDDMLMHMTLINFFSALITTVKTKPHLTCVLKVKTTKAERMLIFAKILRLKSLLGLRQRRGHTQGPCRFSHLGRLESRALLSQRSNGAIYQRLCFELSREFREKL